MMTTMMDPDALAEALGVTLTEHAGGEKGRYYGGRHISLRRGLGPVNRRCALAHELGHLVSGHDPTAAGWFRVRQERQADEFAARLLISPVEYAAAETILGPQPSLIAHELGVTVKVLKTWQSLYERQTA